MQKRLQFVLDVESKPERLVQLLDMDCKAIDLLNKFSKNKTMSFWIDPKEQFEETDAKAIFLARNSGTMHLGFLVAVLKEDFDIEEVRKDVQHASSVLVLLGHIDKIAHSVVKYRHEGGDSDD